MKQAQMHTVLKFNHSMEKKLEYVIYGIIGLVSGGFAYIKGIWFGLMGNISAAEIWNLIWALFVALLSSIIGAFGKHVYDVKFKQPVQRFFKRKRKKKS